MQLSTSQDLRVRLEDADDLPLAVCDATEDSRPRLAHDLLCLRQYTFELGDRALHSPPTVTRHLRKSSPKRPRCQLRLTYQSPRHSKQAAIRPLHRALCRFAPTTQPLRDLAKPTPDASSYVGPAKREPRAGLLDPLQLSPDDAHHIGAQVRIRW